MHANVSAKRPWADMVILGHHNTWRTCKRMHNRFQTVSRLVYTQLLKHSETVPAATGSRIALQRGEAQQSHCTDMAILGHHNTRRTCKSRHNSFQTYPRLVLS